MEIKKFEILEHTGDARIRAFGETKEKLFLNAMLGMNAVIKPKIPAYAKASAGRQKSKIRTIKIHSTDLNALLVDFLSEVNYLAQINKEVYDDAKFLKFSDTGLEAELYGFGAESFGEEIKAVTHHGLDIARENDIFEATILFDI